MALAREALYVEYIEYTACWLPNAQCTLGYARHFLLRVVRLMPNNSDAATWLP